MKTFESIGNLKLPIGVLVLLVISSASLADTAVVGDFNGDGNLDIATGIYGDTVSDKASAGSVVVNYGSSNGIVSGRTQVFNQDTPGMPGVAEVSDNFGIALAVGDFDGDGASDLAIGVPSEDLEGNPTIRGAGAVHVLYGSRGGGLAINGSQETQLFTQNTRGMPGASEENDGFGGQLAAGDFNGDGRDDLVIAIPGEGDEDSGASRTGAIIVIRGSSDGLNQNFGRLLWQSSERVLGNNEDGDRFGGAMATGNFNGDAFTDLAVGAWAKATRDSDGDRQDRAGAVYMLYGTTAGLAGAFATESQVIDMSNISPETNVQKNTAFGRSLSAGDFNGDGNDDIAIGIPGVVVLTQGAAAPREKPGAVAVFYSSGEQIGLSGAQVLPKRNPSRVSARFGGTIESRNLDGDEFADLLVTSDEAGASGKGSLTTFMGSDEGLQPGQYFPLTSIMLLFPPTKNPTLRPFVPPDLLNCSEGDTRPQCGGVLVDPG